MTVSGRPDIGLVGTERSSRAGWQCEFGSTVGGRPCTLGSEGGRGEEEEEEVGVGKEEEQMVVLQRCH